MMWKQYLKILRPGKGGGEVHHAKWRGLDVAVSHFLRSRLRIRSN